MYKARNKIRLLTKLFLYKLILDAIYMIYIQKVFSYSGFILKVNYYKIILSYLILIFMGFRLPNDQKFSSFILWLQFIVMFVPMLTLYSMESQSTLFVFYVIIAFLIQLNLTKKSVKLDLSRFKYSNLYFWLIIFLLTIFTYTWLLYKNGAPSLKVFNFWFIYEHRQKVVYTSLLEYLTNWQGKIINPMILTVGEKRNNSFLSYLGVGLQLLLFTITGSKNYLFIIFAILFFVKNESTENLLQSFMNISLLGIIISYLLFIVDISVFASSLFIRRFLFVPAKLKFQFYQYTRLNGYNYFYDGIIGKIIGTFDPLRITFPKLIGSYFYNSNMNANTGYIGSAYANIGIIGLVLYSVLIGIILQIYDSYSKKIGTQALVGISIFTFLSLNDSDLFTVILTGGLFLQIILLYLFPTKKKEV